MLAFSLPQEWLFRIPWTNLLVVLFWRAHPKAHSSLILNSMMHPEMSTRFILCMIKKIFTWPSHPFFFLSRNCHTLWFPNTQGSGADLESPCIALVFKPVKLWLFITCFIISLHSSPLSLPFPLFYTLPQPSHLMLSFFIIQLITHQTGRWMCGEWRMMYMPHQQHFFPSSWFNTLVKY